jgi:hypothetical protein
MATSKTQDGVSRRDTLRTLASVAGAGGWWVDRLRASAAGQAMLMPPMAAAPQTAAWTPAIFDAHQAATVAVLVELIIPATDTPGARAAHVDRFIDATLAAADTNARDEFLAGLRWLDDRSRALYGRVFLEAAEPQQVNLLTRLAPAAGPSREARGGVDFFSAAKAMTIAGYYSTDIGLRQELGDDGRLMLASFDGCTHPDHQ